jgi:hypothetical protein
MPSPETQPILHTRPRPRRTSEILLDFARRLTGERVKLSDLDQLLGERSFGFLLLLFALPNALPHGLPGISTLTGIPMGLIAFQMVIGLPRAYLPRWLGERSLHRDNFLRLVEKTAPFLEKMERVLKPRWLVLTGATGERLLGAFCLLLAVVLALPIPFGNLLPAIGVALIALGLIEKDGVLVSCGFAVGAVSLAVVWGVLWAMIEAAVLFFHHLSSTAVIG